MASPIYDCSVRTSVVASGGALVQLVPPAAALAATPLPFCIFNTGIGQIADVTLSWTE